MKAFTGNKRDKPETQKKYIEEVARNEEQRPAKKEMVCITNTNSSNRKIILNSPLFPFRIGMIRMQKAN